MKIEDFKDRLLKKANALIDIYYGDNNLVDRMTNTTLKVLMNVNKDKLDNILKMFSKENGEIDAETIINSYVGNIPENGINLDLRQFIKNPVIVGILPNKSLNITKTDISEILK